MDQIEFRPMNNGIQTTGNAMLIDPTTQANYGNGKDCDSTYANGRSNGKDYDSTYANGRNNGKDYDSTYANGRNNGKDYDSTYANGRTNGNARNTENGNGKGNGNGGCNGNGNCNTQTTETGSDGHIYYRSCEEAKIKVMPDRELDQTGRVLDITMTLRNVCPCRHVSVGCLVTEMDDDNNEYSRGFKAFTVEPHYNARACDMELDAVRFILPDDASVGNGTRHFVVRTDAHYADTAVTMN